VQPWASCSSHTCASVIKQYNLVTVGLASHWPCVTDDVVYLHTAQWPKTGR